MRVAWFLAVHLTGALVPVRKTPTGPATMHTSPTSRRTMRFWSARVAGGNALLARSASRCVSLDDAATAGWPSTCSSWVPDAGVHGQAVPSSLRSPAPAGKDQRTPCSSPRSSAVDCWRRHQDAPGPDGTLRAINPEVGLFGVAPRQFSHKTDPTWRPRATIHERRPDRDETATWWEGIDGEVPAHLIDWHGNEFLSPREGHPNSRFAPFRPLQCPDHLPD